MVEFFSDGKLNIAHNMIDRHATGKNKNKTALLFTGANEEKEEYTFGDLKTLSDKFANVLVENGVEKGDRVFIFLPSIPQRYVAFISTLKLGANCRDFVCCISRDSAA